MVMQSFDNNIIWLWRGPLRSLPVRRRTAIRPSTPIWGATSGLRPWRVAACCLRN